MKDWSAHFIRIAPALRAAEDALSVGQFVLAEGALREAIKALVATQDAVRAAIPRMPA
jgi:hypothetical protein